MYIRLVSCQLLNYSSEISNTRLLRDFRYSLGGIFVFFRKTLENDTYHIGYASTRTDEQDLTKIEFVKHTDNGEFAPLMTKNEFEEGVGHHSVIHYNGEFYAVYHGRDIDDHDKAIGDKRTARICKLQIKDGVIIAER